MVGQDDQRLTRKAFEDRHGGVELSSAGEQLESGASITRVARYELSTIDTNAATHRRRRLYRFGSLLFTHFLSGASVALSSLSARTRTAKVPVKDGVKSKAEGFAVALQENNKALVAHAVFASEGAARDFMADAVANDRSLASKVHVIPEFELAA